MEFERNCGGEDKEMLCSNISLRSIYLPIIDSACIADLLPSYIYSTRYTHGARYIDEGVQTLSMCTGQKGFSSCTGSSKG